MPFIGIALGVDRSERLVARDLELSGPFGDAASKIDVELGVSDEITSAPLVET